MASVTISTIQSSIFWEDKSANLQMFQEKLKSLPNETEIAILPEMFTTGFSMDAERLAETMDGPTVQWMRDLSRSLQMIITGSIIVKSHDRYYNRLIWMMPNGNHGYYDKRHLFAFSGEDQYYTAGNKRLIASVKGWKINVQICYDLRFPVWARQSFSTDEQSPEYDILIYVANWPERRIPAWKALLSARAIENQAYVFGVNRVGTDGHDVPYSGDSLIVDPLGEWLYHQTVTEDNFTITLERDFLDGARKKFPFLKDGDGFQLLT